MCKHHVEQNEVLGAEIINLKQTKVNRMNVNEEK